MTQTVRTFRRKAAGDAGGTGSLGDSVWRVGTAPDCAQDDEIVKEIEAGDAVAVLSVLRELTG